MIYLNAAGTSWPKPESVHKAILQFNESTPDQWLETFHKGTKTVCSFFGIPDSDRFLFTQSCTQSLATAFTDFPWEPGDRLIISHMEHHALSRWYYKLQNERGVEGVIIPRGTDGPLDLEKLESELKKGARMVAMSMASNVTGEILPFEEVIRLSKSYGATCLLDGAQTAGIIPIDIATLDPDIFVFAGHKGPMGTQGIGGLYIAERVSMTCPSAACEIAPGSKSNAIFPSYCDVGSAPMMTIAGLTAGLQWLDDHGMEKVESHIQALASVMRLGLQAIPNIEVVGSKSYGRYTGAVSITSTVKPLNEIKQQLWDTHQIKGSLGFQCAPLAHEAIGTSQTGTFRFSVGSMNTEEEVEVMLREIKDMIV